MGWVVGLLAIKFVVNGQLIAFEGWFTVYVNSACHGVVFGLLTGFLSRRQTALPVRAIR
jgi:hypothetical protein